MTAGMEGVEKRLFRLTTKGRCLEWLQPGRAPGVFTAENIAGIAYLDKNFFAGDVPVSAPSGRGPRAALWMVLPLIFIAQS
jgi:hypothetical protein